LVAGRVAADGPVADVLAPDCLAALYGTPFRATGEGAERRVWLEP
jgi:hypothetical protein